MEVYRGNPQETPVLRSPLNILEKSRFGHRQSE
jgi:hypothetical protein